VQTKFHFNKVSSRLIIVACGFLVFSPVSSEITQKILHLPLALPELLFLPFLFIWSPRLPKLTFNRSIFVLLAFFVILLAISIYLHNFRTSSILSTARGYFYMMIAFALFKGENDTTTDDIYLLSLGSVLGWVLLAVISFVKISHKVTIGANDSFTVYGNLVAVSLVVIISILKGEKKNILYVIILGLILSFTTGLRRQIAVFAVSIALALIFRFKGSIVRSFKIIMVFFFIAVMVILSFNRIETFIKEKAPALHFRIFTKTEQFIKGKYQVSDNLRKTTIHNYFMNINTYYFPRGFVSKRTMQDKAAGVYMDFPIIELSYMLGIFILALFFISLIYYITSHFIRFARFDIVDSGVWTISGIILIILVFIEGTNLNFPFITPFTGMVLGKIYTLKRQTSDS
jgi:hypothetical protein